MSSTLEHQIATYADHLEGLTAPVPEPEILSRTPSASPRTRNALIAAAAAAVVVVVVGAVAILTQFGGDQGPLTTSPPTTAPMETSTTLPAVPEDVFSWSDGDLAEWVTEDEMSDTLKGLLGVEIDGEATWDHEADGSSWSFGGWRVYAHNGDHSPDGGVVAPTTTDPRLPQGVTYQALWGFAHGFYGLSGPNTDESICLAVFPPGERLGYPLRYWDSDLGDPENSEAKAHEDRVFAVASMMLQEMGWAD